LNIWDKHGILFPEVAVPLILVWIAVLVAVYEAAYWLSGSMEFATIAVVAVFLTTKLKRRGQRS